MVTNHLESCATVQVRDIVAMED